MVGTLEGYLPLGQEDDAESKSLKEIYFKENLTGL